MRLVRSLVLLLTLTAPALAVEPATVLRDAVDDVIRPGFDHLAEAAGLLEASIGTLCAEPSEATLETSRSQFKSFVVAFSGIEFLRFGPSTEASRAERLLFWPDRKGIALRQVQAILADHDEAATALGDLRQKSIAVQGLGALEFVLFGDGSETLGTIEAGFRCRYAETIAEALVETTRELDEAWSAADGIASRLAKPSAGNADYRTEREAFEELVGALAFGLEAIRDTRLLPFVGREGETPKPKSALFWRSGMTVPAIRASLEGMQGLLSASHLAETGAGAGTSIGAAALVELGKALGTADLVTAPVAEALADPAQKQALDSLVTTTSTLQKLIGDDLATALGLSVGFSSLDGD